MVGSTTGEQSGLTQDFAAWLTQQNRGRTNTELSAALTELIKQCRATGRKGTLQLTISVTPEGDHFLASDEITLKAPQPKRPPAVWFADDNGRLQRTDPNQDTLL